MAGYGRPWEVTEDQQKVQEGTREHRRVLKTTEWCRRRQEDTEEHERLQDTMGGYGRP